MISKDLERGARVRGRGGEEGSAAAAATVAVAASAAVASDSASVEVGGGGSDLRPAICSRVVADERVGCVKSHKSDVTRHT